MAIGPNRGVYCIWVWWTYVICNVMLSYVYSCVQKTYEPSEKCSFVLYCADLPICLFVQNTMQQSWVWHNRRRAKRSVTLNFSSLLRAQAEIISSKMYSAHNMIVISVQCCAKACTTLEMCHDLLCYNRILKENYFIVCFSDIFTVFVLHWSKKGLNGL